MVSSAVNRPRFRWLLSTVLFIVLQARMSLSNADAPTIQKFAFPDRVLKGRKTTVTCSAESGQPPLNFRWLKNGKYIDQDPNFTIRTIADMSILAIAEVDMSSSGNYTCEVTNPSGFDTSTAQLQVKEQPKFTKRPQDLHLTLGVNATMDCEAEGFPIPTVAFYRVSQNDRMTNAKVDAQLQTPGRSRLMLRHVSADEEGLYVCSAENGIDTIKTGEFLVSVRVPARFEEKFVVQKTRRGETANLKCEALGDKPLIIIWTKDKAEIDFNKLARIEKFDREFDKGVSSELIVRTTDRKDGALYGCAAKNEYGSDERNVKLLVVEVPAPPMDVKLKEVWSRTASIVWSTPYTGNSDITKYIIQYWRDRGGPHRLLEDTIPSSLTTVLLKNLQPGTPYAVTVLGENDIGQGQPSEVLKFVTGNEEPSGPPTDVWVEPKSSSSITVTWKPPPREHWNGDLRGYLVGYKVEPPTHAYSFKTVDTASNDSSEYVLTNLMKSTRYNVVVKAFNSAGTGPPSQDLIVKTLDGDVPDAPFFSVVAQSESKITLRWEDLPARNVPITGYALHYHKEGGEWFHIPIIASSNRNRFTLTDLESSTTYKIYMTASNQYGNGDPSDTKTVTTSITGFVIGNTATYVDLSIIVPIAACILASLVVAVVAIIYYKKSKQRNNLERTLHGGKPFQYPAATQRYIDIDKTRMPPEPGTPASTVASYATIPNQEIMTEEQRAQELKAFLHGNMRDRPLPSKPNSLKKKHKSHVYDTAT